MKLTRKKAIELCIELWTWLAKTGKKKEEYPDWEKYKSYCLGNLEPLAYCWFCQYSFQRVKIIPTGCKYCPYHKRYGHCDKEGSFYFNWGAAVTPRTRKKYAGLFLKQIKTLR